MNDQQNQVGLIRGEMWDLDGQTLLNWYEVRILKWTQSLSCDFLERKKEVWNIERTRQSNPVDCLFLFFIGHGNF